MKLNVLRILPLLALLLAACTNPPPPPPPSDPLPATSDGGAAPAALVDLAPGEDANFRLVLDGVRNVFDVVIAELDTDQAAAVELRSGGYWGILASSDTPDYFVRGKIAGVPAAVPGAARAPETPTETALTESLICRGPCIVFDPGSASFYLRVVNTGATRLTASLYLYGEDLADEYEPENDLRSGAPVLAGSESGALELLGDVDYWLAQANADVTVQGDVGGVEVEVSVYDACGLAVAGPYDGGETFRVYAGEAIRVRAAEDIAAVSGNSQYSLLVDPPSGGAAPRSPGCQEVTANSNGGVPVGSVTLGSSGSALFIVNVPSGVRQSDVIQFEISKDAKLEVLSSSGSVLYTSFSGDSFFAGAGSASSAPVLGPSEVVVQRNCSGSCVIVEGPASQYRVRISEAGAGTVSLFAFGRSFDDLTEPANDSPSDAPTIIGEDEGAIEYVGDEDLWLVPSDRVITFQGAANGIALVAEVLNAGGFPVAGPYDSGAEFEVYQGEYVLVRAANSDEAAVAGRSLYFLF